MSDPLWDAAVRANRELDVIRLGVLSRFPSGRMDLCPIESECYRTRLLMSGVIRATEDLRRETGMLDGCPQQVTPDVLALRSRAESEVSALRERVAQLEAALREVQQAWQELVIARPAFGLPRMERAITALDSVSPALHNKEQKHGL